MLGDGCLAAFENPKSLQFSTTLLQATKGEITIVMHVGLVELVGEDLVGRALYDAFNLVKQSETGEISATRPVVDLLTVQGVSFRRKEATEGP